jgi:hypothetical protein
MDMESRRDGCGVYEVGRFLLHVPERQLTCGRTHIRLAPKSWSLLVVLVTRPGRHPYRARGGSPPPVWVFSSRAEVHRDRLARGDRFIADIRALTTAEASRRGVRRCLAGASAPPVQSASVGGGA